ncbi:hypothetical protein HA466_0192690 [Hirschfeldia incana]|nr:hypothetical protein HA466_0192690 [Hirschfeldia incana]
MRSRKGNQEKDDYGGEEDLGSKQEAPSSNSSRDAKENDKASAICSEHSVTEQRRRSKINERLIMSLGFCHSNTYVPNSIYSCHGFFIYLVKRFEPDM